MINDLQQTFKDFDEVNSHFNMNEPDSFHEEHGLIEKEIINNKSELNYV